jgi:hypothetical protein
MAAPFAFHSGTVSSNGIPENEKLQNKHAPIKRVIQLDGDDRKSSTKSSTRSVLSGSMYLDTPRRVSMINKKHSTFSRLNSNSSTKSNSRNNSSNQKHNETNPSVHSTTQQNINSVGSPLSVYSPTTTTSSINVSSTTTTNSGGLHPPSPSSSSSSKAKHTTVTASSNVTTTILKSNCSPHNQFAPGSSEDDGHRHCLSDSMNLQDSPPPPSHMEQRSEYQYSLQQQHKQQNRSNSPGLIRGLAAGQRMRKTWQRDDTARHCTCCGAHFTHFVRRHHCRCCGRIFCNDCSQHFVEIPPEWRTTNYTGKDHLSWPSYIGTFFKKITSVADGTDRVCETCRDDIALKVDSNVQRLLRWIRCCMVQGGMVDLVDLRVFMRVSKTWRVVSNLLIFELRPLQYRLPTELFTKKERLLLWGNRHILSQHTQWIVPLIKCVDWHHQSDVDEARHMLSKLRPNRGGERKEECPEKIKDEESTMLSRPGGKLTKQAMNDHGGPGCTFVGCLTTMCSRTCQGFKRTSVQCMEAEDALKLLSCGPTLLSKKKEEKRNRYQRAAKYIRSLEWWRANEEDENERRVILNSSLLASSGQSSPGRVKHRRSRLPKRTRAWGIEVVPYLDTTIEKMRGILNRIR